MEMKLKYFYSYNKEHHYCEVSEIVEQACTTELVRNSCSLDAKFIFISSSLAAIWYYHMLQLKYLMEIILDPPPMVILYREIEK